MKLVIFGLTVSSSWGNGHATLWRGLIRALAARGHEVHFFERDVPYYSKHRDLASLDSAHLHIYDDWSEAARTRCAPPRRRRRQHGHVVLSRCARRRRPRVLVARSRSTRSTIWILRLRSSRLDAGETVDYIGPRGFRDYDLVISYTGGKALEELANPPGSAGSRPAVRARRPAGPPPLRDRSNITAPTCRISERMPKTGSRRSKRLFIEPARRLPDRRFCVAGAMYPADFPWTGNIFFVRHLPPAEHPAFFSSSRHDVERHAPRHGGHGPLSVGPPV